jgi:protein SCO1/2
MMKKEWIKLLALPVLAAGIALMAQETPPAAPAGQEEVGIDEKLGAQLPLNVALKDEEGNPITLGQVIDKPTILTLNYFRCAGICTPILNSVADIINKLQEEPGRDYQIVTISFDPTDTPDMALHKKANYLKQLKRPIPPQGWRFFTGEAANTKAVCDAVGFTFKRDKDQYVHPGAIFILSPKGKVTRYMYGTTYLPADVTMALAEAAKGQAEPTINRFLQFCFSYDPAGKRYVFSITRAAGVFVILFAAAFVIFLLVKRKRGDAPQEGGSS